MAVFYNIISGSASTADKSGVQFRTSAVVNELPLTESVAQLDSAILQAGFKIGSLNPTFPLYTCVDINARHIGPREVEIVYTWEYRFPEIQYEIGSSVASEQTNKDASGAVITTSYTYPEDYTENPELAGEEFTTSTLVDKLVSETTMTIVRQEFITGLQLQYKAKQFTGKLNASYWDLVGDEAQTWMCTGIVGSSHDRGISYTVRYSFAYRAPFVLMDSGGNPTWHNGWKSQIVFIDPRTDQPPEDAEVSTAVIYDTIDFNLLGLV